MIQRTKRVMEEERQPAVIREASRFMALLSEGKYKRIAIPGRGTDHMAGAG